MRSNAERDKKLLVWLSNNKTDVTTAKILANAGLDGPNKQQYVSKRISQLEDRCILQCVVSGGVRTCQVVRPLPDNLSQKRMSPSLSTPVDMSKIKTIRANDSFEFEAAGGLIERLPNNWDHIPPTKTVGFQ